MELARSALIQNAYPTWRPAPAAPRHARRGLRQEAEMCTAALTVCTHGGSTPAVAPPVEAASQPCSPGSRA